MRLRHNDANFGIGTLAYFIIEAATMSSTKSGNSTRPRAFLRAHVGRDSRVL